MAALLLVGCSFESLSASDPAVSDDETATSSETDAVDGHDSSSSSATQTDSATSGPDTDPPAPSTSGPSETDADPSDDTTGGTDAELGCPDPLPDAWILCEDFEDIDDPSSHFAWWAGAGIALEGPGRESPTAFEVTHFPGESWSGVAEMRFGSGPAANNVAQPDALFDEIWVRFHTRVDDGWPVEGPGDLVELEGIDGAGAMAFISRASATQDAPQVWSGAYSCVGYDQVYCDGVEDWVDLTWLGGQRGQAAVFAAPTAQEWTCVVMHARLNTPGASDGMMEVRVNGVPDSQVSNLNYRGVLDELGFNRIGLPTFMEVPLQQTHQRFIDDVVVSEERLDCDDFI